MRVRNLFTLLLVLLLTVGARAHEGEDHEDLRGGESPAPAASGAAGAAAPAARSEAQELTSGGRRYRLSFTQTPEAPLTGQEVQIQVAVQQVMDPPDPLLGAAAPVAGAKVAARLEGAGTGDLEAHEEGGPGAYGIHFTPRGPGEYRVILQVTPPEGAPFSSSWTVQATRPMARTAALYAALGIALGLVLLTALRARRWGARRLAPAWIAGAAVAGGLAAWALLAPVAPAPIQQVATRPDASGEQEQGVQVPVDMQRRLAIRIEAAALQTLPETVEVPGQLEAPQAHTHELTSPVAGRVVGGALPQVGDRVSAGQVLAEVEEILSSADRVSVRGQRVELEARRLEFEIQRLEQRRQTTELETQRRVAESVVAQRQLELSRAERLFAIQAVAKKEVDAARFALEQARRELQGVSRQVEVSRQLPPLPNLPAPLGVQTYPVVSPISGTVAAVDIASGEAVDPAKPLFRVVDLSTVWVRARVPERYLGIVGQATRARVTPVAFPQDLREARLQSIGTAIDPESRTASVIYSMPNPGLKLLQGMAVRVRLLGASQRVLSVPEDAVLRIEGEERVFVRTAPDRFEARTVQVEGIRNGRAILSRGIAPGTAVVVEGAGQLASELARRGGSE